MTSLLRLATCGAVLLGLGMPATGRAAEFNMKVTTDDIALGKPISGPELKKEDLKYHVVLVEFWGIH